ncbi:MAG: hypothetical protein FJ405_02435 [Verrucomicrobia bacterium]|nr:hypothetical protein [Verrucomicrobiota bacterium]
MNSSTLKHIVTLTGMLWLFSSALAYPPAPHHMFYGMVRDEYGEPIDMSEATVFIQSTNGIGTTAPVAISTEPGINYRLIVPMESGRSLKVSPIPVTGLPQSAPFQIRVKIRSNSYLPIEMTLPRPLGEPSGNTRLDLTLGVDLDGDGLPDAWEIANGLNPRDPKDGNSDADGDGISNRDEYLSGTFAFDPVDGFRLSIVEVVDKNSRLELFVVRGRNYTLQSSSDLEQWKPLSFRVMTGGNPGPVVNNYQSTEVQNLRVEVPFEVGVETNRFFRAIVQ